MAQVKFRGFGRRRLTQEGREANQQQSVRQFATMQVAGFNLGEDRSQRPARNSSGLIGPDHQGERVTIFAPIFNGLITPPDYQEALSLNGYLFVRGHCVQRGTQ